MRFTLSTSAFFFFSGIRLGSGCPLVSGSVNWKKRMSRNPIVAIIR
ncbi:unnamed protein product [Haemonchus placei]|uniref:Secreted protein n=1 Tax=Haemonchus placei TaxID=6290 RepID=A0A0N4X8V4_HAEPC|nr:unnamed protein product [Haemonchus placei]